MKTNLLADRAIVVADAEGFIRVWSEGATAIFGRSAETAIGQSLDIMVPAHLREYHWTGFKRALNTGETRYDGKVFADPVTHGDGSVAMHRGWIQLLRDTTGSVVGVLSMWEAARQEDAHLTGPSIIQHPS